MSIVAASASERRKSNRAHVRALALGATLLWTNASAQTPSPLPPGTLLLPESALPAYEKDVDHAGLIRSWNNASIARGAEIYRQVCHACHGDLHIAGSIPDALRFGQGTFQHGSDPHAMYQTITRGWGRMTPQPQLVPQEKYDVIHYIRESFLKPHNPSQWRAITAEYLAALPKGTTRGPAPVRREPWKEMDYGDFLIGTFEMAGAAKRAAPLPAGALRDHVPADANIAYKAIAIRLDPGPGGVARGNTWIAFEHDTLRVAGAWTGDGFIDWKGINFDGTHVVRPRTVGELLFETADGPGWANPATGSFEDLRVQGLDGRRFGPLPRSWARYRGLTHGTGMNWISYVVGDAIVMERHGLRSDGTAAPKIVRTLQVGASSRDLAFRAANAGTNFRLVAPTQVTRHVEEKFEVVRIPASATPLIVQIVYGASETSTDPIGPETLSLSSPESLSTETPIIRGASDGPFAVDTLSLPQRATNPLKSWMRTSGLDFLPGTDAAVVCTWDGDVWRVEGITGSRPTVTWKRIASGLFQPLGIKVVNGAILVSCRDQIVRLRDVDDEGDGVTDIYESFNSDHQVTEHFHEFAMGLQADAEGNLYYAKSARHDRRPLVPHHGTLLQVSADGAKTEILANGFRAANGVCRNPDGSFFVTDQEGHWNPMNRINAVRRGGFYGNMWSYGAPEDTSDSAMEPPLCWVDKHFDRSPSELLWIESRAWGALHGKLINLSYGTGRLEIVPHERIGERWQGGVSLLPIPELPTGVMRGRFHPETGDLFVCGMSAWGTEQLHQPGGLYRIRRTEKPLHVPVDLRAHAEGIDLVFSDALDPQAAAEAANFKVKTWSLLRSAKYGSARNDVASLAVARAALQRDGRTVRLTLPEIKPTWQMEIVYDVKSAAGQRVQGVVQNTIHVLGQAEY